MDEIPSDTDTMETQADIPPAVEGEGTYLEQLNTPLTADEIDFLSNSMTAFENHPFITADDSGYQTAEMDPHGQLEHGLEDLLMFQATDGSQQTTGQPGVEGSGQLEGEGSTQPASYSILDVPVPSGYAAVESGPNNHEEPESYQLFCSGDEDESPNAPNGGPATQTENKMTTRPKKAAGKAKGQRGRKQTTINAQQKKKAANSSFDAFNSQKKGGRGKNGGRVQKRPSQGKAKGKGKSKKRGPENLNFDSLFNSNLMKAAKQNATKAAIPSFTSKNKKDALKQLVASLAKVEEKGTINADKKAIMEAPVHFNRKPKADGKGGWLHPDLKTSLFHYQLIGVSFMRQREYVKVAPFGGFLCDEMGFGKSLQAIANIVDGRPEENSTEPFTTLIVVPPHLVSHWKKQIQEHVKPGVLGGVLPYHAKHRVDPDYLIDATKTIGVIITTYGEVRSSCPDFNPPPELTHEEERREWWVEHFEKERGPLHSINFRRIILDEAHEIKNHESKTSIAVNMLNGKFRWVISGTPVHNWAQEFYSYFRFLKIPGTGDYTKFCRHYCPENVVNKPRLVNILRAYMLRRTHAETLFGLPILKLPDINENTIVVKFSDCERFLYKAMVTHALDDLLYGATAGAKSSSTSEPFRGKWFKLLLKLRMFTSHLLVAQDFLKHILTPQMMEKFRAAIGNNPQPEDLEICFLLHKLVENQPVISLDAVRKSSSPSIHQHRMLKEELMDRYEQQSTSLGASNTPKACFTCKHSPTECLYVTSCMHSYCQNCFENLPGEVNKIQCRCGLLVEEAIRIGESPPETTAGDADGADEENAITGNWIIAAGTLMPAAKLTAIKKLVKGWLEESAETKVTIFTQFLSMVDILSLVCRDEGWEFVTLTGRTPPAMRDAIIDRFRNNPDSRVMIASLKAGGTGLSLTMARKCILVDLWWNEAIEQQNKAFCRLFRIGQHNGVEMVRITTENTIDDRIQEIQQIKSADIESAMGSKVLAERDSYDDLLKIFGATDEDEEGVDKDGAEDKVKEVEGEISKD